MNHLLIFNNYADAVKSLSNENAGLLFKKLFQYHLTGEEIEANEIVDFAFNVMKESVESNKDNYEKVCERNKKNIEKRWGTRKDTKNTSGISGIRLDTKNTEKEKEKEKEEEKEEEYKKEKEKEIFSSFVGEYEKVFLNVPCLDSNAKQKIVELSENIPDFLEVSKKVFNKLKHVEWTFRDGTKPTITWLLRDSNFIMLANSNNEKAPPKTAFQVKLDEWRKRAEEREAIDGS